LGLFFKTNACLASASIFVEIIIINTLIVRNLVWHSQAQTCTVVTLFEVFLFTTSSCL